MRAFCLRATLAGFLIPSSVVGAQSLALTESEAVARLSSDSPRVRAIRAAIDIARADVLAASRWPNPRITFNRESVAGVTEHMTMVLQPLPITGRRGLETNAASALVDASTGRADEEVRRARADLRLAFTQLVTAQARERELTRARDHLRDLSDILTKREAAGDAAGFDRLRSEREVLDIEADLVTSGADRARAQATVVAFFAASIDPSAIVAAEPVSARLTIASVDALMEIAETARGELMALRRDVEAARFAERAAERRLIPEPEVLIGTKSSPMAGGDVGSVMSIQAQIPLMSRVPWVVDLSLEQQMDIPFLRFILNRGAIARYGLHADDVAEANRDQFRRLNGRSHLRSWGRVRPHREIRLEQQHRLRSDCRSAD